MAEEMTEESLATRLGHYRHLVPFLRFVMDKVDGGTVKALLLDGLSKLSGVFLEGHGVLRVATHRVDPSWTLIKTVDAEQFSLRVEAPVNSVVEFLPESATLVHETLGFQLRITLDMAEVLLRASEGELFSDDDSLALRQQALSFVERVSQSTADRATLLSPSGDKFNLESKNGRIEMVTQR
jgi:hypothetical protein